MKQGSIRTNAAMLAAQLHSRVPNASALFKMGLADVAIALAADAPPSHRPTEQWRRAPFGAKGRGVKKDRRRALKLRAVKRARKLGHA